MFWILEKNTNSARRYSFLFSFMFVCAVCELKADLLHRYSFTDGDTMAVDSVSRQDGTLENGATISDNAVQLNGSNQYVNQPLFQSLAEHSVYSVNHPCDVDLIVTGLARCSRCGTRVGGSRHPPGYQFWRSRRLVGSHCGAAGGRCHDLPVRSAVADRNRSRRDRRRHR